MSIKLKVATTYRLGVPNLVRFAFYQLSLRTGINPVKRLKKVSVPNEAFFHSIEVPENQKWKGLSVVLLKPFGWKASYPANKLDWSRSVLTDKYYADMKSAWFSLSDFDADIGDIKGVWEASRFSWAPNCAKEYLSGRPAALEELNTACSDWLINNSIYNGPNWKCGQEASIRVMHLAFTAKLLSQVSNPEPALLAFVKAHLQRMAPTMLYAVAQDNNHGTSEAAALFIGGSWLVSCGDSSAECWQSMGRKWLENRAKHLIEKDGSFSQYSVNYHRVMLDTYVMAELWRRELALKPFSKLLYERLRAATNWLYQFVQRENGDAPNLGHNDGACLLPLANCDYRDFRPSVQLASTVFCQSVAWKENGVYDEPLLWLGLAKPSQSLTDVESFHFEQGGYIGLRGELDTFVLFNYHKFRFRPAQNDALHVDFWRGGENLLRDGGTFSYNAGQSYIDYYGGTASHNTIQFDEHEQMPRISRFLLGAWLKSKNVVWDKGKCYCSASYKDYMGCTHKREVTLIEGMLRVVDHFSGVEKKAVLRWRLAPAEWRIQGNKVINQTNVVSVQSDVVIKRFEVVQGKESRYYYHEATIPVLEVEVASSGKIITEFNYQ